MEFKLDKPLYKYRSFESAKLFLETCAIYFSSPSQFNDPFEFSDQLLNFTTSREYIKKYVTDLVGSQPGTRKERRKKLNFDLQPIFLNAVRGALKQKRNNCGVFCSSALYDHTLMWSHYADNHKGVCIGIEFPQTNELLNDFILKEEILSMYVNYMDNITTIPCVINNTLFPDATLTHWITTKSKVWEYEKEMRLIKFKNHGSVPISTDWVKEIYFGLLTPKHEVDAIAYMVKTKFKNCTLYDMKFKKNSFQLVREPYKKRK